MTHLWKFGTLLHVAIEALAGELPAATVARARGGVTRAVVLGPTHEAS